MSPTRSCSYNPFPASARFDVHFRSRRLPRIVELHSSLRYDLQIRNSSYLPSFNYPAVSCDVPNSRSYRRRPVYSCRCYANCFTYLLVNVQTSTWSNSNTSLTHKTRPTERGLVQYRASVQWRHASLKASNNNSQRYANPSLLLL